MNKYQTNKIDIVLTLLMLTALILCSVALFYSDLIEQSIRLNLSPKVLPVFMGAYFLLFRLFAKKNDQIDALKIKLAHINSRRKEGKVVKLSSMRNQITKHQKSLVVFLSVVMLVLCVVWVTQASHEKMIVVIGSVLFIFNVAAHGRVYFQIDSLVSDTSVEIEEFVVKDKERVNLLSSLKDDSVEDPIVNNEHLKGYLKKHTH